MRLYIWRRAVWDFTSHNSTRIVRLCIWRRVVWDFTSHNSTPTVHHITCIHHIQEGNEGWWLREVMTKGDDGGVVIEGSDHEGCWRRMVTKGSAWWLRAVVTKGSGDVLNECARAAAKGGDEGWWLREAETKGSGDVLNESACAAARRIVIAAWMLPGTWVGEEAGALLPCVSRHAG